MEIAAALAVALRWHGRCPPRPHVKVPSISRRSFVEHREALSEKGDAVGDARLAWDPLIEDRWLAGFHAGDRAVVAQCYRHHYRTVAAAVGRMLPTADTETVTHEVFYRLLSDPHLRSNFQGGNFAAWITRVATHSAIDYLRRCRREQSGCAFAPEVDAVAAASRVDDELDAKALVERFRRDCLPPEWAGVFDARFLRQMPQREAANELGIQRTTLVYREVRIRKLLTQFLLRAKQP
jgi:RNA polymerase sigma-70 factor (ECF subfamily)